MPIQSLIERCYAVESHDTLENGFILLKSDLAKGSEIAIQNWERFQRLLWTNPLINLTDLADLEQWLFELPAANVRTFEWMYQPSAFIDIFPPVESSTHEKVVNQTPEHGPKKPSSITVQGDNSICHARVEPHMSAASRDAHSEDVNDVPQPVHLPVQLSDQQLTPVQRTHSPTRSNLDLPILSLTSNPLHSTSPCLQSSKFRTQPQPINSNPLPFINHHPLNRIIWLRQSEWPPPFTPPSIVA